jgi:hypothetical protein
MSDSTMTGVFSGVHDASGGDAECIGETSSGEPSISSGE